MTYKVYLLPLSPECVKQSEQTIKKKFINNFVNELSPLFRYKDLPNPDEAIFDGENLYFCGYNVLYTPGISLDENGKNGTLFCEIDIPFEEDEFIDDIVESSLTNMELDLETRFERVFPDYVNKMKNQNMRPIQFVFENGKKKYSAYYFIPNK